MVMDEYRTRRHQEACVRAFKTGRLPPFASVTTHEWRLGHKTWWRNLLKEMQIVQTRDKVQNQSGPKQNWKQINRMEPDPQRSPQALNSPKIATTMLDSSSMHNHSPRPLQFNLWQQWQAESEGRRSLVNLLTDAVDVKAEQFMQTPRQVLIDEQASHKPRSLEGKRRPVELYKPRQFAHRRPSKRWHPRLNVWHILCFRLFGQQPIQENAFLRRLFLPWRLHTKR